MKTSFTIVEGAVKAKGTKHFVKRTILVSENWVKVKDYAKSETEYTFSVDMHLTDKRYADSEFLVKQLLGEKVLHVTCPKHKVEIRPCMCDENRIDVSVVIATEEQTKEFNCEFEFEVK